MTKVFISYAHEDLEAAQKLYEQLRATPGVEPWFDKASLLPGMKWKPAIRKAIRESDYFLALLSSRAATKRGYVQKEMKEALEVRDEFPEDRAFLIPVRLEDCQPPESLSDTQYADLFPNWRRGFQKVLQVINLTPGTDGKLQTQVSKGYEYRCGLVDFDNGLTNLPQICQRLNSVQRFFHFNHPSISLKHRAIKRFEGTENLFIDALPKTLYQQKTEYLNVDSVACLTKYLLAFEDEGTFWNYLTVPSTVDDTFLFISTNQLYEAAKQANRTFEKGIVYNILSQLIVYFAANLGFHKEVRGCILDFCNDRFVMIEGLKAMRLCPKCFAKLKNSDLKTAVQAILADEMRI
jgi:hypothetical protein